MHAVQTIVYLRLFWPPQIQSGNGARQYVNKCSHEGHSSGEMERTWALITADLVSKAALSVETGVLTPNSGSLIAEHYGRGY